MEGAYSQLKASYGDMLRTPQRRDGQGSASPARPVRPAPASPPAPNGAVSAASLLEEVELSEDNVDAVVHGLDVYLSGVVTRIGTHLDKMGKQSAEAQVALEAAAKQLLQMHQQHADQVRSMEAQREALDATQKELKARGGAGVSPRARRAGGDRGHTRAHAETAPAPAPGADAPRRRPLPAPLAPRRRLSPTTAPPLVSAPLPCRP